MDRDSIRETHEAQASEAREDLRHVKSAGVVTGGGASQRLEDIRAVNDVAEDLAGLMEPHIDRLAGRLPKGTFLHLTVGRPT